MRGIALLSLLLLVGCSTRHSVSDGATSSATDTAEKEKTGLGSSPFTLIEARVDGDSLRTVLQYGGGFREHQFQLSSSGPATKSLPRQQPVALMHDANGDMGRALITEERSFDLKGFRDPAQPVIMIRLEHWPDLLEYRYAD